MTHSNSFILLNQAWPTPPVHSHAHIIHTQTHRPPTWPPTGRVFSPRLSTGCGKGSFQPCPPKDLSPGNAPATASGGRRPHGAVPIADAHAQARRTPHSGPSRHSPTAQSVTGRAARCGRRRTKGPPCDKAGLL